MTTIKEFRERFEEIKEIFLNGDDDHQLIYDLEQKIERFDYDPESEEVYLLKLKQLKRDIDNFKEEESFYNAEAELDNMFPNRYDEDFDEDSMSWDSVFGD